MAAGIAGQSEADLRSSFDAAGSYGLSGTKRTASSQPAVTNLNAPAASI
jgi:hypothetical protein